MVRVNSHVVISFIVNNKILINHLLTICKLQLMFIILCKWLIIMCSLFIIIISIIIIKYYLDCHYKFATN